VARLVQMLAILTGLIMSGCTVLGAQQDLDQSEAAYARCQATSTTGGDCEALKEDVDANKKIYDQTSSQPPVWIGGRRFQPLTNMAPNPGAGSASPNPEPEPDSSEDN
jgi:hypothetical protein